MLDGFCGAGGDSIQLAKKCKKVYANDIDSVKVGLVKNNAGVYGVDNIVPLNNDFLTLEFTKKELDAVYFSPPWGGPEYNQAHLMEPADFQPPLGKVIKKGLSLSDNLGILLPNNTNI